MINNKKNSLFYNKRKINFKYLLISIISVILTAIIGSIFTGRNTSGWYANIIKPALLPPNYVFPIAWNIIFLLMIISFYLVLNTITNNKKESILKKKAINLFYIQLVFNVFWTILFFEFRFLTIALIEIIFLEILIISNIYLFSKINKTAAYLLIPYALWVIFATYLSLFVLILN